MRYLGDVLEMEYAFYTRLIMNMDTTKELVEYVCTSIQVIPESLHRQRGSRQ